jgi:F-type H+-transporting ATPase subunit delta
MQTRGPSAEAQLDLRERLDAALAEVGTRKAAQVGDELFSLAALVRSTPSLRRVFTDVSVAGSAKAALLRDLFGDKLDELSLELAADAVTRRWTSTRDLADTLERLSEVAVVRSSGDNVARVVDELFTVSQAIQDNPELRSALSDPARSAADKAGLVDSLLGAKALSATVTLVKQSLGSGYRSVGVALEEYQKVAAAIRNESVARVRVAHELTDTDRARLQSALSRQYGRDIHLNVVVEPALLGGMRVEIGDDVIDGTVDARLDEARRKLAG